MRRTPPKHLELDEALALLAVVPDDHLAMPLAAMTHGLRRNELLGLHFLPLYSGFATLLGRRRQAEGLVFTAPARDGRPWDETAPARVFLSDAYEQAGIRRSGVLWHALRHTYASLLGAGGIKQHEIELLMGHKVADTTGLYLHVMRETFDKVDVILDQAFGDALRARLGGPQPPAAGATPRAQRF